MLNLKINNKYNELSQVKSVGTTKSSKQVPYHYQEQMIWSGIQSNVKDPKTYSNSSYCNTRIIF